MDDHITEKHQTHRDDDMITWYARSADNQYFAIFNISEGDLTLTGSQISELGMPLDGRDVWHDSDITISNDDTITVGVHDVFLLKTSSLIKGD